MGANVDPGSVGQSHAVQPKATGADDFVALVLLHDLFSDGDTVAVTGAQQLLPEEASVTVDPTLFDPMTPRDSSETLFVGFAQQQVPFVFFSAEQQQPDRRPTFVPQPPDALIGSNGHTTEVSTYNAIAHQTRQLPEDAAELAPQAFWNGWW